MYIKNVDGFGGDGTFVSNFGLEVSDQITLTVSRRRFKELNFETNGRDVEPKPVISYTSSYRWSIYHFGCTVFKCILSNRFFTIF